MTTELRTKKAASGRDEIHRLYLELLYRFYEKEDRKKASRVAARLERALGQSREKSIRMEECRSLIAEVRGDVGAAIKHREREISLIKKLHRISVGKPGEAYVFREYSHADLSDRLDLLAILLHDAGRIDRAIDVLEESQRLCKEHGLKFAGKDLLRDFVKERRGPSANGAAAIGGTEATHRRRAAK